METLLVFIPQSLSYAEKEDKLVGTFSEKNGTTSDSFYVLALRNKTTSIKFEEIGSFNAELQPPKGPKQNYIYVSGRNRKLIVEQVIKNFKEYPLSQCHIVQYDETSFVKSELYIPQEQTNCDLKREGDYFKLLAIHSKKLASPEADSSKPLPTILEKILTVFHWITYLLDVTKLSAFTSIGLHIRDFAVNLRWFLERVWKDRGISLQTGNLLFSLVIDILGGLAVAYCLGGIVRYNKSHVFEVMAAKTEELLEFIKYLIKWLMGSPAGLKLNYPLNYILGNFFLYNIYLWWTFLGLIRPVLEVGFNAFLNLGFLGIALQIAILADIFSLVTFHLYCIYIYAARLYEFQIKGLISLSKIFLGRKRNPEPDKVDSCPYSTEQLFVGTVCFTVLLFLLPTTLVYYVVFTMIRLGFIFFGGILTRARYLLQILPLYSSIVWMVYPKLIITTTKLVPVGGLSSAGNVTLIAQPEVSSWLYTMKLCVPSILQKPKSVDWKAIVSCVVSGKLVYPV